MAKIDGSEGLRLHHVFFLERVMVVGPLTYHLQDECVVVSGGL